MPKLGLKPDLLQRRRAEAGPPPTLAEQVQTILTGTNVVAKRLDADGTGLARSASGTLTYGAEDVLVGLADFISGVLSLEKNGSVIATGTVTTGGNSSNTASLTARLGTDGATFGNCKIGRMVALPFIPAAGQITSIKDWVNEVAL